MDAYRNMLLYIHKITTYTFITDISHWYYSKENDWGYGNFMAWQVITIIMTLVYVILEYYHFVC